jgi:hypothetical protein
VGIYGPIEHLYCTPVADALAENISFAKFFMERGGYPAWASDFRCLNKEQEKARRSKFWWKNVYCHKANCKCPNLKEGEVDICVIFERSDGKRLGMYIECKHPTDHFHEGQATRYRERLACWTRLGFGPRKIPSHSEAVAILITDRTLRHAPEDVAQFDGVVTFDEIAKFIPIYPLP